MMRPRVPASKCLCDSRSRTTSPIPKSSASSDAFSWVSVIQPPFLLGSPLDCLTRRWGRSHPESLRAACLSSSPATLFASRRLQPVVTCWLGRRGFFARLDFSGSQRPASACDFECELGWAAADDECFDFVPVDVTGKREGEDARQA